MFKPMLSATVKDLTQVRYPCWCTPKIDGIRCLIVDGEAKSRTLKPIPNKHIKSILKGLPSGLDGELVLANNSTFNSVSSAVMAEEGEPEFLYIVFDDFSRKNDTYCIRIANLRVRSSYVKILTPRRIDSSEELVEYEDDCLAKGYEGVMIRNDGLYKCGRSTVREGGLMKLKKFMDSEATILEVYEKLKNNNKATTNNLGRTERSSHKANKVPMNTLGGFVVKDCKSGVEFRVGSGFNDAQRKQLWKDKDSLVGSVIKYKTQSYGSKDKPRFPIFLGFRYSYDIVED